MQIQEEHFRKLYKEPIIVKDQNIAHEMARNLLIDTVWDDDISGEELKERMDAIEIDESLNSILVIPYIDHTAGMSFHFLTTATVNGNNANITKREDFSAMINIRKDKVNDLEFEYLKNLNVNPDFNLDQYERPIEIANSYFVNDDVEQLRYVEELDASRHEDFPDDVGVLFYKEGLEVEKMWVRYENIVEVPLIEGKLLNMPYQEFGVDMGDIVKFFPYKFDDEDEYVLICNLDSKK